jgi:hypothetical protein
MLLRLDETVARRFLSELDLMDEKDRPAVEKVDGELIYLSSGLVLTHRENLALLRPYRAVAPAAGASAGAAVRGPRAP